MILNPLSDLAFPSFSNTPVAIAVMMPYFPCAAYGEFSYEQTHVSGIVS